MRISRNLAAAALVVLAAGAGPCGGDDATNVGADAGNGADAGVNGPVTAIFELPKNGMTSEFYALPWPNDIRGLDLTHHPRPSELLDQFLTIFQNETNGFGTNQAVYFRFTGKIDKTTLPAADADTVKDGASIYLVNIDANSPDKGKKTPVRWEFREDATTDGAIGPNWLGILPYPGFPLNPKTTYAAVITSKVKGADGTAVKRSADFETVMKGQAAATQYAPLLAYLGNNADGVVSAAVYTTGDPVSLMSRARAVVRALPEPTYDDLQRDSPGDNYLQWEGTFQGPIFQKGTPPYVSEGGDIAVDDHGTPVVQRMETIRFCVTVPKIKMPDGGWPIVIYGHGTGGDYKSFLDDGTAGRMAAQGLAAISWDQVLGGTRPHPGLTDELAFFNFLNPHAARDNVRQGGIDLYQVLRLAKQMAIVDGEAVHEVDLDRIYYFGHSQGSVTGPPALAYETDIKGSILSGAAALIYVALLDKHKPIDVAGVANLFLREDHLDDFNPFLQLVQMFIEPSDPINYASLISSRMNVMQTEGFTDTYAPNRGIEAFGVALGLTPVEPMIQAVPGFGLRDLKSVMPPLANNLDGHTGVYLQYMASGFDGHFVDFHVAAAERQTAQFLGTLAATGTATLVK